MTLKAAARRVLDRVTDTLVGRGFGTAADPTPPVTPPDPLDAYGTGSPGMQATLDIFRGGWSSKFSDAYGVQAGTAELFEDPRLYWLFEALGGVQGYHILELGPLEGAHSCMLEKAGAASVLAIEACVLSYLKCLIVKELMHLERVRFQFGNFMPFLAASTHTFDLILASGVLYHQRDPVLCIKRLAERGERVFIWTHYYDDTRMNDRIKAEFFQKTSGTKVDGFQCELFRLAYDTYLKGGKYRGGVDDHSHWMKKADILACLEHFGLSDIQIRFDQTQHLYGPNLALLARRRGART